MDQLLGFWGNKWASGGGGIRRKVIKRIIENNEEILQEGKYKNKVENKRNKSEK